MSSDYHGYVIKDGKFIGAFEEMYKSCDNPWPETEDDLNNNPVSSYTLKIIEINKFKNVFSIGLGKGLHANWMRKNLPGVVISGCEVSSTAVEYCRIHYPEIDSHCFSVEEFIKKNFNFDVLLFREVLWYILPIWPEIAGEISRNYSGKHIIIEISCYDEQHYGKEYFDGPEDIIKKFPFTIKDIVRHHKTRKQREGMISIFGQI